MRARRALLALAVVVPAGGLLAAALDDRRSTRGGGVPPYFNPTSVAAAGARTWWVLGSTAPCEARGCRPALLETVDGGGSFRLLPRLPLAGASSVIAVDSRELLLLDAGNGRLLLSTDAGSSWRNVTPAGPPRRAQLMSAPQVALGFVYVNLWRGGGNELIRARLRALTGSDPGRAWERLVMPPGQVIGFTLTGRRVLVLIQPHAVASPRFYASASGTSGFRPTGARLTVLDCRFDPAGGALWADCATGMMFGIWRSTDGGRSFSPAGSDAYRRSAPHRPEFAGTSGANFAALSARTALLGLDPLYRSTDYGNSYRRLAGSPRGVLQWFQFTRVNTNLVLALGSFRAGGTPTNPEFKSRLYVITATGTRFHRVRIR